jgi:[ribosomal protein S5]-alanine N-acetyltransferase
MQLDTERLIMRDFREDDWPVIAAYWADPRYQRYYPEHQRREETVRKLVASFVAAQAEQPRRRWQLALVQRDDGRLIGNCGIRVNNPELCEANIGYELNPDDWGQGYASEAARAILCFGFEQLGLHRVWAECVADNLGSVRVLEKLGMRREAHFRELQRFRERWWDGYIYAMLDHEWRAAHRP